MDFSAELIRTVVAYAIVAAIAVALILTLNGRKWPRFFTMPRLRPGRWSGNLTLAQFLAHRACILFTGLILVSLGFFEGFAPGTDAYVRRYLSAVPPISILLFLAVSVTTMFSIAGATTSHIGLSAFRWRPHVALGAIAFLIATPIVLGVYALCLLVTAEPSGLLERLAKGGFEWYEWAILFLDAVVLAPIVEEWLFRGILQGWLRRTSLLGHAVFVGCVMSVLAFEALANAPSPPKDAPEAQEVVAVEINGRGQLYVLCFAALLCAIYAAGVARNYRPVLAQGLNAFVPENGIATPTSPEFWTANLFEAEGDEQRTVPWSEFGPEWSLWKHRNARWSIFGTATAFSVIHLNWPDVVPLFLLGLALGWLSYRTQSIVPSIALHALFNLVAFLLLWANAHSGTIGNGDNVAARSPVAPVRTIVAPAALWPR